MKKENYHDRDDLRWLNRVIPEIKFHVLLLTLTRGSLGIIGVSYAVCLQAIVDNAVAGLHEELIGSILRFAGLVLFQFVLLAITRYLDEYTSSTAENKLKLRLFDSLLQRDYAGVMSVHSGEWMNRLTSDTTVVAGAVTNIIPGAVAMAARMLGAAFLLLFLVPRFAILLLAGGGALMVGTLWMRKLLKRMHRQIQESDGALRVFLTERLGSLMILKAYQQESAAHVQAADLMHRHKAARMKKNWFSNLCNSGFMLVMNGAYVLGAAWCGLGIAAGTVSYGTFTAVIQLVAQLLNPIAGLTGFIPQYYAMLASVERLREVEELSGATAEPLPPQRLEDFRGFGLRDVSYRYPDGDPQRQQAVSDFSMEVHKGEYVAFSGPSGCGKSTVLKLLLCLYDPDSGSRYVSTDQGALPMTLAWSRLFAYVPQGNHLMSGTIREVVSFSRPEEAGRDEEILRCLDVACAREFVEALPQGLDTVLGERGSGLSEGQMQRIAVARALFSERPVLLLDEATSALDGPSEVRLLQNIRSLTGKTVVIITHRPAALEVVDKVIEFTPPIK